MSLNLALRVINAAVGYEYGDGDIVTEIGVGYAEPGYPSDARWVLGNWNNKTKHVPGIERGRATKYATIVTDRTPERLGNALEWIGIELEWSDEWTTCSECFRLVRIQADSYSWTPSYLVVNECEIICHECAKEDIGAYVGEYVNDADKAITWIDSRELSAAGWTQWEERNPHTYENGWHPGQTDDPHAILADIQRWTDVDVVFLIDSVGQFDMRFSAWTRDSDDSDA